MFLDSIRCPGEKISFRKKIINTLIILGFGIGMGIFSKFLDTTASNELPFIIEALDVTNFLGRFAVWVLIALCIALYSNSPFRAGINVFIFFLGMVTSYYLYSRFIAGFFPAAYALIWFGFTAVSPLLAFVCWYARGEGKPSLVLCVLITGVLFNMTFSYGWLYIDIPYILELPVFICGLIVLKRSTVRETVIMVITGVIAAVCLNTIVPFYF